MKAAYLKPPVVVSTIPGIMARHQAEAKATGLVPDSTPAASGDAPANTGGSLVSAAPAQPQQAFFQYTIQPGDTISSIAAAFGVSEDYILWNNPEVSADPNMLLVGEALLVPSVNGIVYHVAVGDTLTDIASVYQIDVQSIIGFVPNGIQSADAVSDGMVLLLPGAVPPPPPIPAAVAVVEEPPAAASDSGSPVPAPASQHVPSSGYIWPFYGNITTYFGEPRGNSYHKGIDIDGFNAYGAPIGAAASGTVIVAAWDDWGLGYHVQVQHDDGSVTVYGHLSEIWVTPGQWVNQGDAVGALGSTGYSTGPHLHFEIHVGGVPVDLLAYLP
ncbi:MAG TPA: M23 family metallopeptidase [Dehalococcoidia bacterium]|nr:M23 family metallopeptidase [Dehalococcoidia bacterium]